MPVPAVFRHKVRYYTLFGLIFMLVAEKILYPFFVSFNAWLMGTTARQNSNEEKLSPCRTADQNCGSDP